MAVARARRTPGARANRGWDRFARVTYWYVLPSLEGVGVAVGVLLLATGSSGTAAGALAVSVLAGLGLAAWVGSLVWLRRRARPVSMSRPTVPPIAPEPPEETADDRPTRATPATPHRSPTAPIPHSGIGRAATSRLSWSGAEIWQRWRQAEAGHLGAPLVPPVGETAYLPPRAGVLHPFAARDRDLWLEHPTVPIDRAGAYAGDMLRPGAGTTPSTPSPAVSPPARHPLHWPHRSPFSADDLDRLFPPEEPMPSAVGPGVDGGPMLPPIDDSVFAALDDLPMGPVARPIAAIGTRFLESEPAAVEPEPLLPAPLVPTASPPEPIAVDEYPAGDLAPPWSGGGLTPDSSSIDHLLYLEAINPIPPHLRSPHAPSMSITPPAPPPRVPAAARSGARTACVACTRGLGDFLSWSPCIGCGQPLCRECLHRSFALGEEGFCWDCSSAPTN